MSDFTDHAGAVPPLQPTTVEQDTPALDALEQLVCAYPELQSSVATLPQQRALRRAKLVLVEAGRKVRS